MQHAEDFGFIGSLLRLIGGGFHPEASASERWVPRLVGSLLRREEAKVPDAMPRVTDNLPLLDKAALERTRAMMGVKFDAFVQLYLKGARGYIASLRLVAEGSLPATEAIRPAHSLKSSAAQVGAMRVSQMCEEIECRACALATRGASAATLIGAIDRLSDEHREVEPLLLRAIKPGD